MVLFIWKSCKSVFSKIEKVRLPPPPPPPPPPQKKKKKKKEKKALSQSSETRYWSLHRSNVTWQLLAFSTVSCWTCVTHCGETLPSLCPPLDHIQVIFSQLISKQIFKLPYVLIPSQITHCIALMNICFFLYDSIVFELVYYCSLISLCIQGTF